MIFCTLSLFLVPMGSFMVPSVLIEFFPESDPGAFYGMGIAGFFLVFFVAMALSGLMMPLSLVIGYFSQVGMTRIAAEGTLKAALDFKAVSRLAKRGFRHYVTAFAVYYAVAMGVGMVVSFLMYTVILLCIYPITIGFIGMWLGPFSGVLLGRAYSLTIQQVPGD